MVVATGFFDGVHLGHRFLIENLVREAKLRGEQSRVVTFWPHPRNVLQDGARNLRLLTTLDDKKEKLRALGVDFIDCINFTKDFSTLSTKEYLQNYIIDKFGGTSIILGYDNRLGANSGTPDEIADIAKSLGLEVILFERYDAGGQVISSTRIRKLLEEGKVEEASNLLGYDYRLYGVVVSGNRLGRTIGFPTANMQLYEPLKLLPARGVYLVRVNTLERNFYGMCNIGYRPTVSSGLVLTIETNIFDFQEDIYGLDIKLDFLKQIRGEEKFGDIASLQAQLEKDKKFCLSLLP